VDLVPDTKSGFGSGYESRKLIVPHPLCREKTEKCHAFMSWQLSLEGWRLPWSVKKLNGGLSQKLLFFFEKI
jgi:hypothetical protein